MVSALVPLANITLGSAQATVTFSSISQSYRDLYWVIQINNSVSGSLTLRLNGDSGANYSATNLGGNGSAVSFNSNSTGTGLFVNYNSYPTGTFNFNAIINLMDYSATDKHKNGLIRANNTDNYTEIIAARWANTSAVTTAAFVSGAGNFAIGSTFALYGIVG